MSMACMMALIGGTYSSPPLNTVAPSVSGSTLAGSTLTTTTGTWTGKPTPTYTYQWQHGTTNIPGATSSTYVVSSSYRAETIRCVVTATNIVSSVSANSNSTGVVTMTVSGSLTGSSTLSIPAGASAVSLTGQGGVGYNNYWEDPGQPYIPDTRYYVWDASSLWEFASNGTGPTTNGYPQLVASSTVWWTGAPTGLGQTTTDGPYYSDWGSPPEARYHYYTLTAHSLFGGGSAGQPYIAPSSGGGDQYGPNTTGSMNGTTRTWQGGLGASVYGTVSAQSLTPSAGGDTLTYSVAAGTSLSYSYTY